MNPSRIRLGRQPDEPTPPHVFADHEWFRNHEQELLERYGECFCLVYHERVIGVGDTTEAAVEDADRNLPPEVGEITPLLEILHRRDPFTRMQLRRFGPGTKAG
jgi:hypothetical protein